MTGGLLGQCELARDDRDTDCRLTEIARCDGELRCDESRDIAELRLELFRKAWIRSALPVGWTIAAFVRGLRLPLLCSRWTMTFA